jgi:membrane-anchored protein YejM (alkaline phosphatase superfamily)
MVTPTSFLIITLDSCRYDTFETTLTPHLSQVGPLHRAMAPGNFTLPSHAAIFAGYTPGVADSLEPIVNPRRGRLFRLAGVDRRRADRDFVVLEGHNFIDGLNRLGYRTLGTGAVRWFDPGTRAGKELTRDFDAFFYPGDSYSMRRQLTWIDKQLQTTRDQPVLVFLNIGETHAPYWHEGARWDRTHNPCEIFGQENDASACRERQSACLSWVDQELGTLLERFSDATTLVCADHGDAWGEDNLWEHGFHHPMVLEVPLLFRLGQAPTTPAHSSDAVHRRWVERFRRLRSRLHPR